MADKVRYNFETSLFSLILGDRNSLYVYSAFYAL